MWFYYLLLFVSALIFSSQFLITKQYQRYKGESLYTTVKLSLFAYLTIAAFFFVKGCIVGGGLVFGFSWFTFAMTLGIGVVALLNVYMGIKVLAVGDMSVYSVFMMLGSLLMPTFVGLIFYEESFGWLKGIAIALMFGAIVLSVSGVEKGKFGWKALLYYIGIFVTNGLIGVFFTVHQNNAPLTAGATRGPDGTYAVNSDVFMTWYGLSTVLLTSVLLVVLSVRRSKIPQEKREGDLPVPGKAMAVFLALIPSLYGICNGLGDYFIALATAPGAVGSSVTFPIINGGTILFSTIIGWILYKEKIKGKVVASMGLVLVSTILFMFA